MFQIKELMGSKKIIAFRDATKMISYSYKRKYTREEFNENVGNKSLNPIKIENQIQFIFYKRVYPKGIVLSGFPRELVNETLSNNDVKFIIHGWRTDGFEEFCQSTKNEYLEHTTSYVFIVNWGDIALSNNYETIIEQLVPIADYCTNYIKELIVMTKMNADNIHLIGHSLGAHISGMIGRRLLENNITIGRITGLDPALPGFEMPLVRERISKSNAKFIDIIHTCGDILGFSVPMGHVDFYPNGGISPMPGCYLYKFIYLDFCSHSRSWNYFRESIFNTFIGVKCENFDSFKENKCSDEIIELGPNISTNARGNFYFNTGAKEPFSLEYRGIKMKGLV